MTAIRIEIGFNARYLLDITGADRGQRGASSSSPTPPRRPWWAMPRDASALYVLMPMRV